MALAIVMVFGLVACGGSNLLILNVVTSGSPDVAKEILAAAGDIPVLFFNRAIGS